MAPSSPAVAVVAASPLWGLWARPADHPGKVALALAVLLLVVALVPRGPRWLASSLDFSALGDLVHPRRFLTIASFAAAFLSLAYIEFYLHGGPRAAQSAELWLQGRAMTHAAFTWTAPDPEASFRGTGLILAWPDRLAGIAPPGYPLLLAPAFLVGAPMLVGPLLAAGTVIATWLLAREVVLSAPGRTDRQAEMAGRVAAGLSVVCVALRYETADSVPGGLVALALACALLAALRAVRRGEPGAFLLAGLAAGTALATSPCSGTVAIVAVGAVALCAQPASRKTSLRSAAWGLLPGALLLLAANHAAIGRAFGSPARFYVAALVSHGAHAGARSVATETLGALRAHLADVANLEPLALLVAVPLFGAARSRAARAVGLTILAQMIVDLVWMGRGAAAPPLRSPLGNVLPLEHALLGVAVITVLPERVPVAATLAMALSLAGFALHTSHAHLALAAQGDGQPGYQPDVARESGVAHGLLFFDDDAGYELASDPSATASHGVEAARLRSDDHDRLLYDLLGHPPAHRFLWNAGVASVTVWTPPNGNSDAWRFEAEADWPPMGVTGGRVDRVEGAGMCPSDAKALSLEPVGAGEATMAIELPSPPAAAGSAPRAWRVIPRVFLRGGPGEGRMALSEQPGGPPLATWTWKDASNGPGCLEIAEQTVTLRPEVRRTWLLIGARGGAIALDKTVLRAR